MTLPRKNKGSVSKLSRSVREFNYSLLIIVAAVVVLIAFKKFQSPLKTYGDFILRTKEEAIGKFNDIEFRLLDVELTELNNLMLKGMRMLPPYEKDELRALQEKFAYKGSKHFDAKDVERMRMLNYKGINLLPEEDQARFHYLMLKGTGKMSG
ncbi:MAG: hypothetical protein KKH93_02840, partial [Candidatus Omnitrophica bacterium]|nr:hypothetical protein [Candidatus Omnitrophota bacterium]